MTELRYDDRVVLVTGAGRGIGRAHALLLASRGAKVVVADDGGELDGRGSTAAPAEAVVAEIQAAGGTAASCATSIAEEEGAALAVRTAIERFGRLDAVVNNAGIHDPGRLEDLTVAQFRRMLDVHFFGTLFTVRAAWGHFVAAGYGRIVNTVSEAMLGGIPDVSSYGAAKGAVFGLTRNLATAGADLGIRANALAPRAHTRLSAAGSEMMAELLSIPIEVMEEISGTMPPELCAPASAFLAHESCPLNGEVLQIGMGGVARIAVVRTLGIHKAQLTPEDIADNLEAIMDVTGALITDCGLPIA